MDDRVAWSRRSCCHEAAGDVSNDVVGIDWGVPVRAVAGSYAMGGSAMGAIGDELALADVTPVPDEPLPLIGSVA
jgi:hypothetical protein